MRSLSPEVQEERRRQAMGLRQAGQTYTAIAAQVGLTPTGVFDICKRFAERGPAGLKSQRRGPAPGHGCLLTAGRCLSKGLSGAHHAASLISWMLVSRSGFRQTSPTGAQFRIWRDHRAGLAARASV